MFKQFFNYHHLPALNSGRTSVHCSRKTALLRSITIIALTGQLTGCFLFSSSNSGSVTTVLPIGSIGICKNGNVTVDSGPTFTQVGSSGAWQLSMKVCVYCDNTSGNSIGVSGAIVKGVLNDDSVTANDNLTSTNGVSSVASGCTTLTKRISGPIKSKISGKTYQVIFEDSTGQTLGRTSVTLP